MVSKVCVVAEEKLSNFQEDEINRYLHDMAVAGLTKQRFIQPFIDAFAEMEDQNVRVSDVVMNAKNYSLIRRYGMTHIDLESRASHLMKGLMGILWGANIWVLKVAEDIQCFGGGGKELSDKYPQVVEAKKSLGMPATDNDLPVPGQVTTKLLIAAMNE